jgi:hypothetical protein
MNRLFVLPILLAALAANAQTNIRTISFRGHTYVVTVNSNGAVLRAAHEVIYMGNDCDVVTDKNEQGT